MKNVLKRLGIMVFAAVIGFSLAACGDDGGGKEKNPFIGTWDSDELDLTLTLTDSTWTNGYASGTYTYSDNTAILIDSDGVKYGTATFSENTITIKLTSNYWGKEGKLSKSDGSNKTPTAAHFTISGAGTVYFDPTKAIPPVTVTAQSGKTTGKITVYYEGKGGVEYPKVDAVPVFFGDYNVTFDVEAATGWNEAKGFSAGTLSIKDGTPDTPTGLSVALQSTTSIKVSWTSVPRATSYKVYYITEGKTLTLAGTATTNSFTHTGLILNTSDIYYYYVIAVNASGESDYSNFKSIVIDKPVAPANVSATAETSSKVSLRWGAVSGATEYEVYYSKTNNSSGSTKASGTFTSASASITTGLTASTTYYFWIKAKNPFGTSDYSTVVSAATPVKKNNPPINVYAEVISSDMIKIGWTPISTLSGTLHLIYYTTGSPYNDKSLAGYGAGQTTHYYLHSVKPNTTYYYWVTWKRGATGEESEYSEMVSAGTGPAPTPPPATPSPALPPAASTPPSGGGIGEKPCPSCKGSGDCSYQGFGLGQHCNGTGILECSSCGGTGIIQHGASREVCSTCKGAKTVKCGICNGSGKCTRCKGSGKI